MPQSADVARAASQIGPRDRQPLAVAAVAHTFEELAAFVGDAAGPSDIELLPRVYHGDLTIKRPVAIRGGRGHGARGERRHRRS